MAGAQIPLKEEDIPKSAFCCKFGQFEMTRMPFGLNNSASTFQRTMELGYKVCSGKPVSSTLISLCLVLLLRNIWIE